jgi:hypothetical protein
MLMPTMTKRSCWVLYLGLLVLGQGISFITHSYTANVKKPNLQACQSCKKVIGLALIALHHDDKTTINDKWLTLEAFCKLMYCRFDLSYGIDFTVGELKRAVNTLGPVTSKISQGNHTGIHFCKKAMKACHTTSGYSTRRTHKRQSMDTMIGTVGSPCGFHLAGDSNQNVLQTICFQDSLPGRPLYCKDTSEDFP